MSAAPPPGRTPTPPPAAAELAELLSGLATAIADAEELLDGLAPGAPPAAPAPAGDGAELVARGLERRLEAAENDRRELSARLVEAERRAERLMTLYVATYHLHAALDPLGVEAAIAEIAVDLLGARRFVLLLEDDDGTLRVAMERTAGRRRGDAAEPSASDPRFAGGRYAGGDPLIDGALADGALRIAGPDEPAAGGLRTLAAVPLNLGGQTAGVLALLELFEQKRALTAEDRDILDLLAAHAASALTAAQLFSVSERKLQTYRSLIELAWPGRQDGGGGGAAGSA
ncbi:MAG TPA: GAF domain-containing protein [Thermoanaerobaculia bacterium]|nr:GAF domain-containing protein [Thermoanaerobaculia bacterium]